jgi:putative phosphoribosyl transferase
MGAIASGGVRVVSEEIVDALAIPDRVIAAAAVSEEDELARQERTYREGRAPPALHDRVVMLVDDGLATGSTMQAAVAAVRASSPRWVVVAVPVGSPQACAALRESADDVICLETPARFSAVGEWYQDFSQTTDEEVRRLLREETVR